MDAARWDRIQEVFHGAASLEGDARRAFLKTSCDTDSELCAEVEALLAEDARTSSVLDGGVARAAGRVLAGGTPQTVGPYRITSPLGEGGMGVVYRAERADLGRAVAVKFLPDAWLSPARRERFAAEQRILARLDHPCIARLYDADVLADGTPWFAMELVEGEPITEHCAQHDSSVEERLQLFRAACEAVRYAHDRGVIHRDLKPAHVMVKADGSVRLLDFGIARQLDALDPASQRTRTGLRLITPAYAAPEQIRGGCASAAADVYSLGVILYELLAGRRPFELADLTSDEAVRRIAETEPEKPSQAAQRPASASARPARAGRQSWVDLDVICLTAMQKDPQRRYPTVDALIRDIDHFLRLEPLDARPDTLTYRLGKNLRRNRRLLASSFATFVAVGGLAFTVGRTASVRPLGAPAPPIPRARTVAVVPFQNVGPDRGMDFLRLALPDEVATALSSSRSLVVRPFETTSKYTGDLDVKKAGGEMAVDAVVTGHFSNGAEGLRVVLDLVDVGANRLLWQNTFQVPSSSLLAMKQQIVAASRGGLSSALGVTSPPAQSISHPRNEEAYDLYLRSAGLRYDPGPNAKGLAMMERAVTLDPEYAPAWLALARRYYVEARYGDGHEDLMERYVTATERALALDPEYITAGARLTAYYTEKGELAKSYQVCRDLIRRRPDNADAHFWLSYVLRYAGLLDESARECETALSLDPHNFGWRSCFYVSLARGDPKGAMAYLDLDAGSEYSKALSMHVLVWQGMEERALQIGRPHMPRWKSFDLLLACLERRPATEIAALARKVRVEEDPELNYLSAGHLAYCGQTTAALEMLQSAVQGGYCSFPAMDSDRLLASLRSAPEFPAIRALGAACQSRFLVERSGQAP
jgi:serine/threonine protein kinase/TolB-like protein